MLPHGAVAPQSTGAIWLNVRVEQYVNERPASGLGLAVGLRESTSPQHGNQVLNHELLLCFSSLVRSAIHSDG